MAGPPLPVPVKQTFPILRGEVRELWDHAVSREKETKNTTGCSSGGLTGRCQCASNMLLTALLLPLFPVVAVGYYLTIEHDYSASNWPKMHKMGDITLSSLAMPFVLTAQMVKQCAGIFLHPGIVYKS